MRATIRSLLLANEDFAAIYPADKLISASAVTLNVQREAPFCVIRFGPTLRREVRGASTPTMSLWCHDVPGDYGRIDAALRAARVALDVWNVPTANGFLIRSEWTGDGEDLYDDGFKTIVRQGRWDLTGSGE